MTLTEAFAAQARVCPALGSPFMGQLMGVIGARITPDHGTLARRMFDWPGDVSSAGASLPLRLAGGLHALVLQGDDALVVVYPPNAVGDDALWDAVSGAMLQHEAFLHAWIDSPPQTNELRRAAVLRAMGQWLTARFGLPLELCELGASAGLNLNWDRFALTVRGQTFGPADPVITLAPDWTGPLPPDATPRITTKRGVDLNPLSPDTDHLRLMAYLWPDQADRLARMDAALTLPAVGVDRGDAADWLEALTAQRPDTCRLICHTVAWQYFPDDTAARARAAIERMGDAATQTTPVAWFGMEADGGAGAALTLRLWPGDLTLAVGRVDFHGRWVNWALT
ncbi:DUF2332 domain-containing protein [Jannaschia pohangensis]|uniref:DUF2332 domain-containing protein n=1 Tax=Jannaschia pohangensis TaxID=390807 RepID=A0A1I3JP52_9RHOB|nr:DUF2332 family protein [Jannaschia pohangensis]SFI61788.1 hypothetical protein SAMN04488095_1378 [Jannaschia pohangensis]